MVWQRWWENKRFSRSCAKDKLRKFLPFTITVETVARSDSLSMATDVELVSRDRQTSGALVQCTCVQSK